MRSESTVKQKKSPETKTSHAVYLAKHTGNWSSSTITNQVSIAQEPQWNLCFGSLICNTDIYSNHLCKAIPDNFCISDQSNFCISDQITEHMKIHFVSIYLLIFLLADSELFTQLGTFFFKSTLYFLELCCFTFFISQVFFFQNLEEKNTYTDIYTYLKDDRKATSSKSTKKIK